MKIITPTYTTISEKFKKVAKISSLFSVLLVFTLTQNALAAERLSPSTYRKLGAYFVSPGLDGICSPQAATAGAATTPEPTTATPVTKVYVLGDSITARAATAYTTAFTAKGTTATVDGSSGRSITGVGTDGNKLTGLAAIDAEGKKTDSAIKSAGAIVIALGTNGNSTEKNITDTISALKSFNTTAPIYWVDTTVIGRPAYVPTIKAANTAIHDLSTTLGYKVISWYKTVTPTGDPKNPSTNDTDTNGYIVQADQYVHPTPAGITALVALVTGSVGGAGGVAGGASASIGCCSALVSSDASLLGSDNMEKAFNYFVQKGLTKEQAAGIVGNMIAESGVVAKKLQFVYNKETSSADIAAGIAAVNADRASKGQSAVASSSFGFGIVQWTPWTKYVDTEKAAGKTTEQIDSLSNQLDFLMAQLDGSANSSLEKDAGDKVKASATLADAAFNFGRWYERFRNSNSFKSYGVVDTTKTYSASEIQTVRTEYEKRVKNATDVLSLYGSGTVGAGGTVVSSGSGGGCSDIGGSGKNTKFVDGFTVYSQLDPDWKDKPYTADSTIGVSGCGPTSMAMIVTALKGQSVNPVEIVKIAVEKKVFYSDPNGGVATNGTIAAAVAESYQLKSEPVAKDVAAITAVLNAGGLVLASGTGPKPFTSTGHYIVVRGITADGKFKVADSFHDDTSEQTWDAVTLVNNMRDGNIHAITK